MYLLPLIIMLFSTSAPVEDCKQTGPKYQISGHVLETHHHQGGIEVPYDALIPNPLIGQTLYVVSYRGGAKKPVQFDHFETDENGYFAVKVPAGFYGFVEKKELLRLSNGQYLPGGWSQLSEFETHSVSWTISTNGPVEVVDQDVSITLTKNNRSTCMMCP